MTKVVYMTEPGLRKLREELDRLVNIKRPKISQQIGDARDKGDLSENEANVREEKIAINTPIGKGLVGKKSVSRWSSIFHLANCFWKLLKLLIYKSIK